MTYNEFIQNIIDTRGQWNIPEGEYYEVHHILAACLGGLPERQNHNIHEMRHINLIWLYPEEHYEAHRLLAIENQSNKELVYAYWAISNKWNDAENRYEFISKEDYKLAKLLLHNIKFGVPQPPALNKKRSNTMLNKKLVWFTNGDTEFRCTVEQCPPGFYKGRSNALKENNSKKCKERNLHLCGEANGMYGKHHTDETKQKQSEWSAARSWYTDGVIEVFEIECPKGFKPGRLKKGPCKKATWKLPDGSIREMRLCMVKKFHPDWVLIDNNGE